MKKNVTSVKHSIYKVFHVTFRDLRRMYVFSSHKMLDTKKYNLIIIFLETPDVNDCQIDNLIYSLELFFCVLKFIRVGKLRETPCIYLRVFVLLGVHLNFSSKLALKSRL
jgi:hypothetical protein